MQVILTEAESGVTLFFEFTTEFDAPDISGENPADGSAEVPFNPTLSADIHDAQGESVEWEIWTDAKVEAGR